MNYVKQYNMLIYLLCGFDLFRLQPYTLSYILYYIERASRQCYYFDVSKLCVSYAFFLFLSEKSFGRKETQVKNSRSWEYSNNGLYRKDKLFVRIEWNLSVSTTFVCIYSPLSKGFARTKHASLYNTATETNTTELAWGADRID